MATQTPVIMTEKSEAFFLLKKFQVAFSTPERRARRKIVRFIIYFVGVQLSLRDTLRLNTSFSAVESRSGEK